MGQYHIPINKTRKEFLSPSSFDDGRKLIEFSISSLGTMTALALLLAGRWSGDSIAIVGDYKNTADYRKAHAEYKDVSSEAMALMLDDPFIYRELLVVSRSLHTSADFLGTYKKALEIRNTRKIK